MNLEFFIKYICGRGGFHIRKKLIMHCWHPTQVEAMTNCSVQLVILVVLQIAGTRADINACECNSKLLCTYALRVKDCLLQDA